MAGGVNFKVGLVVHHIFDTLAAFGGAKDGGNSSGRGRSRSAHSHLSNCSVALAEQQQQLPLIPPDNLSRTLNRNVGLNGLLLQNRQMYQQEMMKTDGGEQSRQDATDETLSQMEAKVASGTLEEEFHKVPRKRVSAGVSSALRPENLRRNRYRNILPYEDTRVMLMPTRENGGGYINASNIQIPVGKSLLKYIATQAPMENTAADFWQMIWESGSEIIVMLTACQDEQSREQCFPYFPTVGQQKVGFGEFTIIRQSANSSSGHVTTMLTLKHTASGLKRKIYHLLYTDWQTSDVPKDPASLTAFLDEVNSVKRLLEYEKQHQTAAAAQKKSNSLSSGEMASRPSATNSPQKRNTAGAEQLANGGAGGAASFPVVVHCCSGVGRTGSYLLIEVIIHAIQHNQKLSVPRALLMLRQQRMLLVQTNSQYQFVYKFLVDYLKTSRLI